MSMNFEAHKDSTSEMNVTPLIDVLLVLLIIFMVMPHHRGEQADIPMPDKEPVLQPYDPIVIQLLDNGDSKVPKLTINTQDVAWDSLETRLREIYAKRIDKAAFLKGDPEIEFRYAAEALDTIHRAGAERVGLMGSARATP